MLIYPAIDLYAGQAVRLQRGDYARMTVYSDRPETVAADFAAQGARQLHLIDLEGAKNGGTPNLETIVAVKKSSGLFCQVGGMKTRRAVSRRISVKSLRPSDDAVMS